MKLHLFIIVTLAAVAAIYDWGIAVAALATLPVIAYPEDGELLGKRKSGSSGIYVKGEIRGAVQIPDNTAGILDVFAMNQAQLNGVLAGAGHLTNQTGTAGTYNEEGHILVSGIKFNIINLASTGTDFFKVKQIAQNGVVKFTMGGYQLFEGFLGHLLREQIQTYNTNAPADSVLVSNPFVTVSLGQDGYKINKGDGFNLTLELKSGVALPVGETTKWFFVASLLGKKTLPAVKKSE